MGSTTKGIQAEKVVYDLLKTLQTQGVIGGFKWHPPNSHGDTSGIDFTLYMCPLWQEPFEIHLQVKAGTAGLSKRKYRNKGIYCIKNVLNRPEKFIKKEIIELVKGNRV